MKAKISEQAILCEIDLMKRDGYKIKKLSKTAINKLRIEANKDSYYIMNEGLWAWLFRRVVIE